MINTISAKEASNLLSRGEAILFDVRDPDEFRGEHIAYASSLPLASLSLLSQLDIPPSKKIIFQCMKGKRGEQACRTLTENGIAAGEVYNLDGGIAAWKQEGLPVISLGAGVISIFRQVQIVVGILIMSLVVLGFIGVSAGFIIAGVIGGALLFAGLTGWCGLAMLLSMMPWNKAKF